MREVRGAICLHEATHAAVALHLGLTVRELRLKGWTRVPRYCAQLYPILIAGIPVKTAICLLEEDCLDNHPGEVLISMAAPSFLVTDDAKINASAEMEAKLACRYARKHTSISPGWVLERASHLAAVCEPEVFRIAQLLQERGVLSGDEIATDERRRAA